MKQNLTSLQKSFFNAIREPLNQKDRLSLKSKNQKWVDDSIAANDRLSSQERFEIYARQYWFRILESLYDDFPGLRAAMGDQLFEKTMRDYILTYPSQSYTLRDFGARLPHYLHRRRREYGTRFLLYQQIFLLEWAQIEVFDAPPSKTPKSAKSGSYHFQLASHLRLLALDYPLDEWQIHLNHGGVREQLSNGVLDRRQKRSYRRAMKWLTPQKTFLVVHRYQNRVYFKRIESWSFHLLKEFEKGASLERVMERGWRKNLFKNISEAQIHQVFQEWSALGWIQTKL